MRLNIKSKDCKYYVDKDHRKVICVIRNTKYLFLDYVEDFNLCLDCEGTILYNQLLMPTRFIGIATCASEDTFDESLGCKIAFNKAKTKLHNSFFKRAQIYTNKVDEEFNKMITSINTYGECLARNAEKREKEIEALLGTKEK